MTIIATDIIRRLDENGLKYGRLELGGGAFALVVERGGRVFGPFLDQEAPGLLWAEPAWGDTTAFVRFLQSGHWNQGGERNWIAPEIHYIIQDRERVAETVHISAAMDPGNYRLSEPVPGEFRLSQDMTLEAYNVPRASTRLHLETDIRSVPDPLRYTGDYSTLSCRLTYMGYEQVITLAGERGDPLESEVWNLLQLPAGGEVLLPIAPGFTSTDYTENPVGDDVAALCGNYLKLKITGKRNYKAGYQAVHHTGRLGYYRPVADGRACLAVRNFYNNPSTEYIEEPWNQVGHRGDSIHIFSDDGYWGGFGELEVHGETIGGKSGRSATTTPFVLWHYLGQPEDVRAVARLLLGIDYQP